MPLCPPWRPLACAALLLAGAPARAADETNWPRWRGPHDNGAAAPGVYPVTWSAATNVLWKTPLPGRGCSTPIVWNRRIFLTAPVAGQDALLAFDDAGQRLWQTTLGAESPGKHRNGSGCNPSAVTDGRGLYVYFKSGTLAAVELDGRLRWQTNLQERYGRDTLFWDFGSSPALTARDVVMAVQRHGDSYLAAFDQRTGALHWKVAHNRVTPVEGDHCYATPLVFPYQGREALLVLGGEQLTAYAAADGRPLWTCGGFKPKARSDGVPVASPVSAGDVAVVPYGRGAWLHGVRLGGAGAPAAGGQRLWQREGVSAFVPTPAAAQDRVYILGDRGDLAGVDTATGRTLWRGRLPENNNHYYASPLLAGGCLYAAREDGVVYVVRADETCALLAENVLGERLIASPVPAANRLLLRGEKNLYCIGIK
ncbi:MAG: PQQ-binding-like beta-propeller repeat protein [Kiritimatiellaeota bacterium]|nr:PQQ-binding-like beta-propeller repeat protein [Kiritimatiellota bacterium]